jgi:hypothetical protein
MQRPSEHWKGFDTLNPDSDKYKRIQLLLCSANFEHLQTRGMESRQRRIPEFPLDVTCSVNKTQFTFGFNNLVLEMAFSDNIYWIARIPYGVLHAADRTSMISKIATMNMIHQRTTIPIPQVFDFETSADQPFGYPFVFMEYLGGRTLDNGLAMSQ